MFKKKMKIKSFIMNQITVSFKTENSLINSLKHRADIKILKNHQVLLKSLKRKKICRYIFILEIWMKNL